MADAGKRVTGSRHLYLQSIRPALGKLKVSELTRENFLKYGKERATNGAGPATIEVNFSHIRVVMAHAEAVHGVPFRHREFALARSGLRSLGLLRPSRARTRRPTVEELNRLIDHFANKPHQIIPMDRIIQFAVATAMREAEIFRLEWADVDLRNRLLTIRDRKAPRCKEGNHEVIPILNLSGFDALHLLLEQKIVTRGKGRVFSLSRRECRNGILSRLLSSQN
ncbi:tyrosine-type recombinase/integrase [Bradyrhizobium sp. 13971]